jgi:hypothetical protein
MLRYKPEGRGFDSLWCDLNSSLTDFFRPQYGPGFDSASNIAELNTRNIFYGEKGGRC